eukprot:1161220-Pelagomonas_calceolata.AAC.21
MAKEGRWPSFRCKGEHCHGFPVLGAGCFAQDALKERSPSDSTTKNTWQRVDDSAVCNVLIDASGKELHTYSAAQGEQAC